MRGIVSPMRCSSGPTAGPARIGSIWPGSCERQVAAQLAFVKGAEKVGRTVRKPWSNAKTHTHTYTYAHKHTVCNFHKEATKSQCKPSSRAEYFWICLTGLILSSDSISNFWSHLLPRSHLDLFHEFFMSRLGPLAGISPKTISCSTRDHFGAATAA